MLDYAHVELTLARRWYRRTALGKTVAVLGYTFGIFSLCAAVALGLIMLTGGIDNEALLPVAWVGTVLSACAVLGFFVPWALTPYRQWDRTMKRGPIRPIRFSNSALHRARLTSTTTRQRASLTIGNAKCRSSIRGPNSFGGGASRRGRSRG